MIICGEFVAWAREEAARIERGEAQRYHAVFCDPAYGLEFMGKEWDAPHKSFADPKRLPNIAYAKAHGCPSGNKGYSGIKGPSSFEAGNGYQRWTTAWAAALIPLLYPGALVFCFGGTRTWHRLACGFEDAGFQIWDTLMWLHGQGFPKAQDISKLIDKVNGDEREIIGKSSRHGGGINHVYGLGMGDGNIPNLTVPGSEVSVAWSGHKTAALKPAWEPVLCFKAPTQGKTYAELALEYGSGALNVDGGRIGLNPGYRYNADRNGTTFHGEQGARIKQSAEKKGSQFIESTQGRYPANLALECSCEETGIYDEPEKDGRVLKASPQEATRAFGAHKQFQTVAHGGKAIRHTDPDCPAAMLDAQAGDLHGAGNVRPSLCRVNSDRTYSGGWIPKVENPNFYNNKGGGPSRFFYCAKASRSERKAGLENSGLGVRDLGLGAERTFDNGRCESCGRVWIDGRRQGDCCESPKRTGIAGPQSEIDNRQSKILNDHPTVKPLALCRWLGTLLLPPESIKPRRLLVPFAGTGSEMIGALEAGWDDVTGIEQDAHYCQIGRARVKHWTAQGRFKECPPGAARWPRLHRRGGLALRVAGFPVRRLTRSRPTSATD
jgi:site-specific DNA-methyltransferase (adenine-specific)